MNNWKAYFAGWASMVGLGDTLKGRDVERLYQAIKARGEAEAKEKLTERFGPLHCQCPWPYKERGDFCKYSGQDEVCEHPSNKPPEPECEHRVWDYFTGAWLYFKDQDHKHCRDCGKKLDYH